MLKRKASHQTPRSNAVHGCGKCRPAAARSSAGVRLAAVGGRSSGLALMRTARPETCRYLGVIFRLRCRAKSGYRAGQWRLPADGSQSDAAESAVKSAWPAERRRRLACMVSMVSRMIGRSRRLACHPPPGTLGTLINGYSRFRHRSGVFTREPHGGRCLTLSSRMNCRTFLLPKLET